MTGSPYFDATGCLNDAALRVISTAPPGHAPAAITAHLASCSLCQGRYLAYEAAQEWPDQSKKYKGDRKQLRGLAAVLLGALIFFVLTFLYLVRQLGNSN